MENGLINARYLHVLMRHGDKVKMACRSNMANSFCGAIMETSPAGLLKRPSYYVMQLYARHARPIPLRVEQPGGGLDVFACGSEDGKSATIFAVNPGTEPVAWSCHFAGFVRVPPTWKAEAVCDTEDRRQKDLMNHWESPLRIRTMPLVVAQDRVLLPALSVTAIDCETP